MKETQASKKAKKPFIYSLWFLILLTFLVLAIAKGTWGIYQKERESSRNAARVQEELRVTTERHESLVRETEILKTEQGVERALREKFQISKENESVIVIVDEQPSEVVEDESNNPFSAFWSGLTGLFKKGE